MTLRFTDIGIDVGRSTHRRGHRLHALIDVVTVLAEVLYLEVGLAQDVHLDAVVLLRRCLPANLVVGIAGDGITVVALAKVLTPAVAATAVVGVHVGEVVESLAGRHDVVVTHQSVAGLQLQHGEDLVEAGILPELLVRDDISHTDRGEETPAVSSVELLRSVVSEVSLHEVAVVVGVGHAARQAQVAHRQRAERATRVAQVLLHLSHEQRSHAVTAEVAVVLQGCLEVVAAGGRLARLRVVELIRSLLQLVQAVLRAQLADGGHQSVVERADGAAVLGVAV